MYDGLKARFGEAGTSWRGSKVTALCVLLCLVLGAMTAKRNLIWRDHETFVRRMIADAPEHFLGYELLGTLEGGKGNYSAMADSYYQAEQKTLARNLALGREYLALGRLEEAVAAFERLMKKFSHEPKVLNGMGEALLLKGKPFEAIAFFRQGALICPSCTEITDNLRKVENSGSWQNQ
jgi:tetratricopeptide (TPR) repeat protein